jgi:hypothetical protein
LAIRAHFGAVITSQLASAGTAECDDQDLDPGVLDIAEGASHSLSIAPGGSLEADLMRWPSRSAAHVCR